MGDYLSALPRNHESWKEVLSFLPEEWEEKCYELGALRRTRKFSDSSVLLRTLLIHLLDGCSLREMSVHARFGNLADVSDVAILKRLHNSGEWFRWLSLHLLTDLVSTHPLPEGLKKYRLALLDATHVREPGSTGTDWRIHYAFSLTEFRCLSVQVTDSSIGESFRRFDIEPGFVYIADRGYYHLSGIEHVISERADVIVRMRISQEKLYTAKGKPFNILQELKRLASNRVGDWQVYYFGTAGKISGRICAIRKNKHLREQSKKRVRETCARKQKPVSKESLKAAEYVFVFTTLSSDEASAQDILDLYRGRWQIELVFKRLKSIIGLGHLPKQDPQGAQAWLQGKLFCALLIESLIQAGERFFPWGYELKTKAAMV